MQKLHYPPELGLSFQLVQEFISFPLHDKISKPEWQEEGPLKCLGNASSRDSQATRQHHGHRQPERFIGTA
jgi:hypothetical protein